MKLTESSNRTDNSQRIENVIGDFNQDEAPSRLKRYRRTLDAYVLAPLRIAWADWRARFGFFVIGFYIFMAYIWALMYPNRIYRNVAPRMVRPFNPSYTRPFLVNPFTVGFGGFSWTYTGIWQYPLGTNQYGKPLLASIVSAAPRMAELVLAGSVVSIILAVAIGTVAGYKGGFVDELLMGITDIMLTIPGLPLVILLAAIFTPKDPFILGMILAIDNWPGLARTLRSQVLTIREESYVEASRSMGVPVGGIVSSDIVPQLMPYVLVNAATAGKKVIIEATALYFLGFLSGSVSNWGQMMDQAYQYGAITNLNTFYLMLWPLLTLSLLSFGLVMLAQGLDQIFNPRLRARHARSVGGDNEADPTNV